VNEHAWRHHHHGWMDGWMVHGHDIFFIGFLFPC
jgi:hypothetical protein